MSATVTIVIPVWNGADLLRKLLATIAQQTLAPIPVIVVDNGSTDEAPDVARTWGARVISMGTNSGFAAAANRGIAECDTEWVALVNSDVELRPDWMEKLLSAAVESEVGLASGKILMARDPRRLDGTYDLIARSGFPWRAGHGSIDDRNTINQRVDLVSATAVLYRLDLFEQMGGFAEIYESYLEDVDFALRCAVAGFEGLYVPLAVCEHRGSASAGRWSGRVTYLFARNQSILVRRLFSPALQAKWRWQARVGQFLWGLLALRHGRFSSWLRGRWDAGKLKVVPVPLDAAQLERIIERSEARLSDLHVRPPRSVYWRLYFRLTGGVRGRGVSD